LGFEENMSPSRNNGSWLEMSEIRKARIFGKKSRVVVEEFSDWE